MMGKSSRQEQDNGLFPGSDSYPTAEHTVNAPQTERDSLGPIEVSADRLWGAQTQRSLEHFDISTERMPDEIILALATVIWPARRKALLGFCLAG